MHFESTKWRSYEIPSVRLFVLLFVRSFSPEPHVEIFLFLEVKMLSNLKNDGVEDFEKENLVLGFFEPKGHMRFFKFYKKLTYGIFLIFCMNLQQQKSLKIE